MNTTKPLLKLLSTTLFIVFVATTMSGCSLIDLPFGPGTEQEEEEEIGNENTGSIIPEEPLTSGPATVTITRATATTARFEGSITNEEVDLDFVQVTLRYGKPNEFSAMNGELPNVVLTRPDFDDEKKFSFRLEGLDHNTTYKFCAIVQYKNDVFYSDVEEFKTASVNVNLSVKDGSVTENSVELAGTIEGISKEDRKVLEVGFFYSPDKSLVEKGEGTKVVLDNIGEDGSVLVSLTNLYLDGPTYHFCPYVKQGKEYDLRKAQTFELIYNEVKLIKKITRTEQVLDEEWTWLYEFEYNDNTIVGSKWSEIEDGETYGYRFTYDYSTKGKVVVERFPFEGADEMLESTYDIDIDAKGNALKINYAWEDESWENGEETIVTYNYVMDIAYTPEGYLSGWSETEDETPYYAVSIDYVDGRFNKFMIDRKGENEDYDSVIMNNNLSSDHELRNTSFDLNRVLVPFLYPEIEPVTFGAVKLGTYGKYYFDRMMVQSVWEYSYIPEDYGRGTTTDAQYKEVVTYNTYEFENLELDLDSFPITSFNCDENGYPTEVVTEVRGQETEITVTYGAGEVAWQDNDGTIYYYITEVDRKSTQKPVTTLGKCSMIVEYYE